MSLSLKQDIFLPNSHRFSDHEATLIKVFMRHKLSLELDRMPVTVEYRNSFVRINNQFYMYDEPVLHQF